MKNWSTLNQEKYQEDRCGGYKYPDECPFNGVYQDDSPICKECCDDVDDAMKALENPKVPK